MKNTFSSFLDLGVKFFICFLAFVFCENAILTLAVNNLTKPGLAGAEAAVVLVLVTIASAVIEANLITQLVKKRKFKPYGVRVAYAVCISYIFADFWRAYAHYLGWDIRIYVPLIQFVWLGLPLIWALYVVTRPKKAKKSAEKDE
jgi:hypothetical protein